MVAVIAFLLILLIVDVGGLIDLSQIKIINNSNNTIYSQDLNGTSSTTNPIKFKVDVNPSTATQANDGLTSPDVDITTTA